MTKFKYIRIALISIITLQLNLFAQCVIAMPNNIGKANEIKIIKSNASLVTLFLNGAQVSREVSVQIPAGKSILKLDNLSPYINQSSIQVKTNKRLAILSVNYQLNHLAKRESSLELKNLESKLEQVQEQLIEEKSNLSIVLHEIGFLQENRKIAGANTTVTVGALQQAAAYYKKAITKLKSEEIEKNRSIKKLTHQEESLKSQIQELAQEKSSPTGEIVIKTEAPTSTTYNLKLTYVVSNAGWSPSYDIRAQSINQPLKIAYKANVTQKTQENWENVKLRFSSANPNLSGRAPILTPYYLRYPRPIAVNSPRVKLMGKEANAERANNNLDLDIIENQTTVEFAIDTPYTINSDGKEHSIEMSTRELPTSYEYYSAPKLDKDAFLIAKVTEWEKHNLLEGVANIFFEGTFIGKTHLDINNTKDTLELSLGRDKSIAIKREKVKSFTTKQFIGNKQEEEVSWRITVKNNKNVEIDILLTDQVPLSTTEEIEVYVKEKTLGKQNNQTGQIEWELNLKPLETKELILTYRVKYPKNRSLIIQ
ncbi:MAG: DUF4139 domain-containing protein [Bacteroidales bacterium]